MSTGSYQVMELSGIPLNRASSACRWDPAWATAPLATRPRDWRERVRAWRRVNICEFHAGFTFRPTNQLLTQLLGRTSMPIKNAHAASSFQGRELPPLSPAGHMHGPEPQLRPEPGPHHRECEAAVGQRPGCLWGGGRGGGCRGEKTPLPSRREGRMAQRRRARGQREQGSVRGCGWKSRRSGHKTPDSGADARSAAGPPEKRQHREPVPRPEPSTPRDGPQEPPAEPAAGAPSVSGPPGLRQAPAK